MKNLIQCGTCGYPLTPEERGGLIEVYGVMVKPEQQEPVAYSYTSRISGAQGFSHHPMPRFIDAESWDIKPLYTSQPAQQEPYCYVYKENGEDFFAPPTGYFPDDATPLYTSPPAQRKPLTDEQREQIYQEWASKPFDEVSYDDLMLAVEAAHGIKENT